MQLDKCIISIKFSLDSTAIAHHFLYQSILKASLHSIINIDAVLMAVPIDQNLYQQLIGYFLSYLVPYTCPDLAFVVSFLSIFLNFRYLNIKRFLQVYCWNKSCRVLDCLLLFYTSMVFWIQIFMDYLDTHSCCPTTKAEYIPFPLIKQLGIRTGCNHSIYLSTYTYSVMPKSSPPSTDETNQYNYTRQYLLNNVFSGFIIKGFKKPH